jgi:predicted Rossmann-fold nucleotide-binding protein
MLDRGIRSDKPARIGVIGPTNIEVTSRAAHLDPAACETAACAAGKGLAERGCALVLVPDRGVALLAAEAYRAAGGRRLIGIIPHGGTSAQAATSCCEEHRHLCHETVEDLTWTGQHERICQLSDILLCVGLSCGTLSEIAWTKWVGNTPVVILRPLVSGVPPEMAAETDLHWVEDLESFYYWMASSAGIRN